MTLGNHGDEALAKLVAINTGDLPMAIAWLKTALEALDWIHDEDVAHTILLLILLHDGLARALNGRLGSAAVDRAVKAFLGSQP